LNDGLRAYYTFNGNANDESGNANNGTVSGAILTTDRVGNTNSAYLFDGLNDKITLTNESSFDFDRTDSFSYSVWIKTDDTSSEDKTIFAKMMPFSSYTGFSLYMLNGNLNCYLINTHVSNEIAVKSSIPLNDNGWHHIGLTFDGSSDASGIVIYIDGAATPFNIAHNTLTQTMLNDVTPTIGSRTSTLYFKGALDDIRVYSRTLTPAEMNELAEVSPFALTQGIYLFDVKASVQLLSEGKKGIAVSKEGLQGMLIYDADTATSRFVYKDDQTLTVLDADFSYVPYTKSEEEHKNGQTALGAASAQFSADGFLSSVVLGSFRYQETATGSTMTISLAGTGINTEDDICGSLLLRYNQKNSDTANNTKGGLSVVISKMLKISVQVVEDALSEK
jgi:hypothetical protein